MKYRFLKLSIIGLTLACSAAKASDAANVIPTQKPGFAIGITGLYLKPSANNLNYAIHTTPLPLPAPNWEQKVVNPSYSGAYNLALQYNLMNNRENVKLDWLHFNSTDSATANSTPNTSVGPTYYYGPAQQFIANTVANSTVKFSVDNVNLVFGHLIDLSNNIQFEPFVGLSAAYLKEGINNNYWGTDPIYGLYTHNVYTQSKFTGFGPRVGFNGSYFFTNHFAITGSMAGNLLAGELKYKTNFASWTAYTGGNAQHNNTLANTSMANQNISRIVPEMDAKIAVLYKVLLDKSSSELTVEAGYTYAVYFNAINQVLPTTLVPGSWEAGSVAIINQSPQQQTNLDLRGPFLNLAWKF